MPRSMDNAMAAGAAVLQSWGTLLAAVAEEVMSQDKLSAGNDNGSGWMDGAEEPPETKQRRTVYERLSCKESVFGKMLTNEAAVLDPAMRGARHFVCAVGYRIRSSRSW